jgi:TPR repeat protein
MFPDYHELQNLPHAVKHQILESISKIGLSENEGRQRKADACYTVAMLHLQRIGTVRLKEPKTTEYIGYEIECDGVLRWLRRAAELGSPSAQAMYYPLHQALGAYLETKGRHAEVSGHMFLPPTPY